MMCGATAYKSSICPLTNHGKMPENIYVDIDFKPSVYPPPPRCQAWPIEPTQTLLPVGKLRALIRA